MTVICSLCGRRTERFAQLGPWRVCLWCCIRARDEAKARKGAQ